jgi:hypothetical protein
MNKGDLVLVKAEVEGRYWYSFGETNLVKWPGDSKSKLTNEDRCLYRSPYKEPREGMFIGINTLPIGSSTEEQETCDGYPIGSPHTVFQTFNRIKVMMFIPIEDNRYRKPIACLPEDIELCITP